MLRKTLFICLSSLLISVTSVMAQTSFPEGCYMSMEELIAKRPSVNYSLNITPRTNGEKMMRTGNDFKIVPTDRSFKSKVYNYDMVAFSDGKNLYINGSNLKFGEYYSMVLSEGKALFFTGIPSKMDLMATGFKNAGEGKIAAASYDAYGIFLESGEFAKITVEKAKDILAVNQEVLNEYIQQEESAQKDGLKMIEFLKKWNES